jgi:gliding motility-associated-like protein
VNYSWNPATGLSDSSAFNPTASPTETTTYVVTITDANGCVSQDSVTIDVLEIAEIFIPNAFSPNNDDINDELLVINTGIAELAIYEIYNRWGKLLFSTNDVNTGWDGTYNGKEQDVGTYVYLVKVNLLSGKSLFKSGNVTLVR